MKLDRESLTYWICGTFLTVATVWIVINIVEYLKWVLSGSP